MRNSSAPPRRVLMTLDAVGGVWRYAADLARTLAARGTDILLVGLGPPPAARDLREIGGSRITVRWTDLPLDWMVNDARAIADVPRQLLRIAEDFSADLLHLNLPTQASRKPAIPTVVASHSCFATWWRAVKHPAPPPQAWEWHRAATAAGFRGADAVIAPSRAHADALRSIYGCAGNIDVVHNGSGFSAPHHAKQPFAAALGRWWDDAKNAATLDAAAALCGVPICMGGSLTHSDGSGIAVRHATALGPLGRAETADLLGRAAVFVSPALYEPFGLAVLEAARARCALVLADIPTFRELWSGAAVFVDPRDHKGFAREIEALARNPARAELLSQAAARRAEHYTLEAQADRIQEIYAGALTRAHVLGEAV